MSSWLTALEQRLPRLSWDAVERLQEEKGLLRCHVESAETWSSM